ncbi:hypothetical protein LEM8419_03355 [Neolewinella maritima]|uniref:Outer membrane protein beta-barrel domain-containing protein n=1 Tax=Neolewinella maritima TaxID=1383882 RepID=A0ABN8F6A0_9BACT|nr:porin family protein [Neolewinella maritima]CAH1002476.1 hypothetical protein LEM8419_03355 [Neolewinella maritima]
MAGPQVLCSQTDSSAVVSRLQVGVTGGYMLHEVDFTPSVNVQTLPGRSYGLALRYFDKQLVGFQAEVNYVEAGWEETYGGESTRYERRTRYAELQLLTQFSIGRGLVQPLIQLGPYVSVPLSEEELLPADFNTGTNTEPDNSYRGRPLPGRINYGLRAGVGLNVELGPVTLQVDGRYLQGFSNLIKPGESQASTSIRQGYGGQAALFFAL